MARFGPRQRRRLHAVRLVRAPAATGLSTIERPWREEGLRVPQRKRRRHRLGESTVSAERQRACNRVLADRGRVSPLCGRRRICRGVRSQVVAITGGSAGVGRATALAFARRGHPVGLHRPRRGAARVDAAGARGAAASAPRPCRPTSPTPARSRRRPSAIEAAARPDRRLGQQRHGDGLRAGRADIDARGVPPRDRGHLPRLRLGHAGRAAADAAARPGRDRAGRLGARLPGHPAAGGLLRRQARDPGLPRVAAHRAACTTARTCG